MCHLTIPKKRTHRPSSFRKLLIPNRKTSQSPNAAARFYHSSSNELLAGRERINARLQGALDQHANDWGMQIKMVELKQVDLPEQMIRAIGRQADAERERRAKVIHAEGEYMAAEKLSMAAEQLQRQPAAIQLRYLQTLVEIGVEKNTTVVFPVPVDMLTSLDKWLTKQATLNS